MIEDLDGLSLELFADTATVTYQNGQTVKASEMTEMARKRDSNYKANNIDYGWTLQGAFSVDLDPTRGGEHVHADYVMNYDDGEQKGGVNANLRFYIIDGKIVGAISRIPKKGSLLSNISKGGKAIKITLSNKEKKVSKLIASDLKKENIFFAGIDFIDQKLNGDINITSPTGLKTLYDLTKINLAETFWKKLKA